MLVSRGRCGRARRADTKPAGPEHHAASCYQSAARIEERSVTNHPGQLSAIVAEERPVQCPTTGCAGPEFAPSQCASFERAIAKFSIGQRSATERATIKPDIAWHAACLGPV
jgi:hypothetical protein